MVVRCTDGEGRTSTDGRQWVRSAPAHAPEPGARGRGRGRTDGLKRFPARV
ncbi:hypothetical protein GZL_05399 [Streptomyces sp. 769]|nr:hypothetical protein GZL_05399 [Streptomyces sp. 769]